MKHIPVAGCVELVIAPGWVGLRGPGYGYVDGPTWYKWPWRDLQKCVILALRRYARDNEREAQGRLAVESAASFALEVREVLLP